MNWRTPSEGDMREVRRFAWLPVMLNTGRTVWLEHYLSREWRREVRSGASDERVLRWTVRERLPLNARPTP